MLGAGLLAQQGGRSAASRCKPWVKTIARAGQPGGHRLFRQGRPADRSRQARLQPRRLRLHDLHRQFRAAARADRRGDRRRRSRRSRRCSPAIAISRAASIRRCAPTIWPRRRWSSPTRWPARCNIDLTHRAARRRQRRQAGLSEGHLADERRRSPTRSRKAVKRDDVPARATATCSRAPPDWQQGARRRAAMTYQLGIRARPISRMPPYFEGMPKEPAPVQRRDRRARAGDLRRQHHHRPHLAGRLASRRTARPATT